MAVTSGDVTHPVRRIAVRSLDPASFAPYGVVVTATPEPGEAEPDLSAGRPRFYVMRLADRPPRFTRITRHLAVTQSLAAAGGGDWLLAVAPPADLDDPAAGPAAGDIVGFRIPGDVAVTLHRGTWHAGPFFDAPAMSFFNLELTDTNEVDHHSVDLVERHGSAVELVG